MAKRLELLKQVAPSVTRAGVLLFRGSAANRQVLDAMQVAADALKMELQPIEVANPGDFENSLFAAAGEPIGGLVAGDSPSVADPASIVAIAERRGPPLIGLPLLASSGGLLGYDVDFPSMWRRSATFVDKILKGANPGDIPIEQATRFRTIVNLKTANAIGVDIPPLLLAAADEVIE